MHLSPIGEIVRQEWYKSFKIRTELFCDIVVIMPNHIHTILRIEKLTGHAVETHSCESLRGIKLQFPNKNYGIAFRQPKLISSFIAGFKSVATKRINIFRNTPQKPVWQSRFNDHIIRSEDEYRKIFNYIKNNSANWAIDSLLK
jgi:REP element-mobilizing transposase RayT